MLGFNTSAQRFVDKSTGRFISRSRGLLSSTARKEQAQSKTPDFITLPYEELERAIEPGHGEVVIDVSPDMVSDFYDDWADYWETEDDMDIDQDDPYGLEDE